MAQTRPAEKRGEGLPFVEAIVDEPIEVEVLLEAQRKPADEAQQSDRDPGIGVELAKELAQGDRDRLRFARVGLEAHQHLGSVTQRREQPPSLDEICAA